MRVGWIGLGHIGLPMARRVHAAGFELWLWSRRPAAPDDLPIAGARRMQDLAELAAACDVVCSCVSGPDDVLELQQRMQPAARPGTLFIDLSTAAPGNGESLGGIKVETASGWFAACPSGTEDIYKIYAESFRDEAHLRAIVEEAQAVVKATLQRKDPHESGTAETNMKS